MTDTSQIPFLPDGECIPGPGAYRTSMEHYHSQDICPGISISSTDIRNAALKSPHAFWKTSRLNPDRYPERESNDAFTLGRAAHALILGDEVFDEHFVYVPADAPRRPTATQISAYERTGKWSDAAAEGAAWWEAFDKKASGRLLLKEEQVQKIKYMAENLAACPEAVVNLTGGLTEISMIWQDQATGLWIKSRPDCIPDNGSDFGDLKTFTPKGADLILAAQRAITDHGYALQMALAIEAAEQVFNTTANSAALIFIQTTEPFEPVPIELDEEALYWGRVMNRHGIDLIHRGLTTGEWPGRAQQIVRYSYPPSMLHRFGELQANGSLPLIERMSA